MWYKLNLIIKFFFDFISALIGIIILLPFFLILSICIKIDSRGHIFFRQNRLTKNGRLFKMLKFRSMVVNAETMGTGLFNYENDPRVTKMGRLLRNSSLDELPQLLNVLKGDMSFVGPRPPVSYELGDYNTLNRKYKKRFSVVAGITGLAQIQGRNEVPWEKKVEFDNVYIEKFKKIGFCYDLKILFMTVIKVFKTKNIYEIKSDESIDDAMAAQIANEEVIKNAHIPD